MHNLDGDKAWHITIDDLSFYNEVFKIQNGHVLSSNIYNFIRFLEEVLQRKKTSCAIQGTELQKWLLCLDRAYFYDWLEDKPKL